MNKIIRRTITLTLVESWTITWLSGLEENKFASQAGESPTEEGLQKALPKQRTKWEIVTQRHIVEGKIVEDWGNEDKRHMT